MTDQIPIEHAGPGRPPRTILICDDQAELRQAVREVLSDDPRFEVVGEAVDGRSSLEQLVGTKPDVLLLDVNMPGGGPDVARAAKHLRPATRILVFTALGSAQIRRDMVDAGADAFLVKTGRLRPLLDALSEITTCR